ncbi:MAG: sigma-54-dependent transcriptional regulator, partial [Terriglobales bacterium]
MANILLCDDERSICEMLDLALRKDGHRVETVNSGAAAQRKIDGALYDMIVTDVRMPSTDGLEVLRHARRVSPDSLVLLITALDDSETPIQALNAGAFHFIRKGPALLEDVKAAIALGTEKITLRQQNFAFRRDAASRNSLENIIGTSPPMEKLKQTIRTVASTGSTIVIKGESGTGKELVARAVHA